MNIIVLACACRVGGALTIYKQFLSYLPLYVENNNYYIFVDSSMPQPNVNGVTYIHETNHSWKRRIWLNKKGVKEWMESHGILADVIVSLQNTGIITNYRQVIYYHQSLPFYQQSWNPFKRSERTMFLYKHIYPWFVKMTINDLTDIVVQIPFIKRGFIKCFGYPENKIHVMFPDIEEIDVKSIPSYHFEDDTLNFVYPAIGTPYKQHKTLIEALSILKNRNPQLAERIRFYLTIDNKSAMHLYKFVQAKKVTKQFIFMGKVNHEQLLSMYKASVGLCFPSTIETLGLPLLEAACFGLPILASSTDYAREVIGKYEGVQFINFNEYKKWADAIEFICLNKKNYPFLNKRDSSWPQFFELILNTN